jgi:hypothetical protein
VIPCKYLEAGSEVEDEPIKWIIAWVCDRCGEEATLELCDDHYGANFINPEGTPQKFNCPECQGNVSWVARRMDNLIEDELINDAGL